MRVVGGVFVPARSRYQGSLKTDWGFQAALYIRPDGAKSLYIRPDGAKS